MRKLTTAKIKFLVRATNAKKSGNGLVYPMNDNEALCLSQLEEMGLMRFINGGELPYINRKVRMYRITKKGIDRLSKHIINDLIKNKEKFNLNDNTVSSLRYIKSWIS